MAYLPGSPVRRRNGPPQGHGWQGTTAEDGGSAAACIITQRVPSSPSDERAMASPPRPRPPLLGPPRRSRPPRPKRTPLGPGAGRGRSRRSTRGCPSSRRDQLGAGDDQHHRQQPLDGHRGEAVAPEPGARRGGRSHPLPPARWAGRPRGQRRRASSPRCSPTRRRAPPTSRGTQRGARRRRGGRSGRRSCAMSVLPGERCGQPLPTRGCERRRPARHAPRGPRPPAPASVRWRCPGPGPRRPPDPGQTGRPGARPGQDVPPPRA